VVSGGSLNLRAFAHTDAPILGIYPEGTLVSVLSKGEIWSQVSCQGQTGYMLSAYLSHHISAAPVLPSAPAAPSVPETPKANASVSTKNGGRLNLRQDASAFSAILTSFANGTRVQVLTHGSLWCKVRVGEWVGYMKTDFLAFDDAAVSNSTAAVNNPQNTQVLHLRQSPSVSSRSLAQYRNGKLVTVLGVGSQWCRVRVDGLTGYMMTRYLTLYYGAPSAEKTVVNPGTYVNLRSDSSYDGSILMQVAHGTKVTVLAPLGAWSRVRVGSMSGYMVSSFLR